MFRRRIVQSTFSQYSDYGPLVGGNPRFLGRSHFGEYRGYGEVGASSLLLLALVI